PAKRHPSSTPAMRSAAPSLRFCMGSSFHVTRLCPLASEERAAMRLAHPEVRFQTLERLALAEADVLAHEDGRLFRRARDERFRELAMTLRRFRRFRARQQAEPG